MDTPINDGGPAFPVPDSHDANGQVQYGCNGMTLRDYFAAKALQGMMANQSVLDNSSSQPWMASAAFWIADAMLAAREKGQP